ncbi:MAG: cyclic nucleotide-binding domain-containing protein [Deltaproteobacteria bacterium]|nr:cyclic nucleotide-binding domain-containing protein [Deltaproteobacteria bacterium]MBT6433020.1 cyclic nucleotide-binding domain-containing protein [Deltaproteobacteria bacterium]
MSEDSEERIQSFSAGEVILKEGDPGTTAYIIHQGSVTVTKKFLGKDQALGTLQKGDFFGEISLITEAPRTATVRALEDVQLMEMDWPTFQRRVRRHGFLAVKVIKSLVERLAASLNTKATVSQELQSANAQLAEAGQQRLKFIKTVAWELQIPLSSIIGPLKEEHISNPESKNLDTALKNAYRLLRIITQTRDLQLLASEEKVLSIGPVNLTEFLSDCGDYFKDVCADRQVNLALTFNGDPWDETALEDIYIEADIESLEKIVFNYLSNALKFTRMDVNIELGLLEWNGAVRCFVRDNGPGIAPEHLPTIFNRFSASYEGGDGENEGVGIGLVLVQKLAKSMGGTVGVDTLLGEGATFYYECQQTTTPQTDSGSIFEAKQWMLADILAEEDDLDEFDDFDFDMDDESDGQYEGFDVLVIDGVEAMRALIGRTLERLGCTIHSAGDGREGLLKAQEIKPDLIITDWDLKHTAGPDLIKEIRATSNLSHTRFIMLTTKTDEASRQIGKEIGVDSYLGKPFNDQEVTGSVKTLLEERRKENADEQVKQDYARKLLQRFLPPPLIEEVLSSGGEIDTEPKSISATILFSDLVGFTALTSKLRSVKMARILNEYLHCMNNVIFEHGGTVDKFIGDAIMVIFGAPNTMDPEIQAQKATDCAMRMQEAMVDLNEAWSKDEIPELQMRIGIHHGPVVVGHFGSEMRSDYTAIGPTVNLASRIEGHCDPGEVYVSGEVCDYLPEDKASEAGSFELKGVSGERTLYKLNR